LTNFEVKQYAGQQEEIMDVDARDMKRIDHCKLTRLVARAFEQLGVPADDAEIAAKILVAADLRGVDTHGVIRFSPNAWYVKWLTEGSMTARPNLRVISESASTALVDGDRGMGMVIGQRAMEIAIRKARESGLGTVGVRNSRHYGMSAYYAMMALPHGMIGIAMTNASRQVVPTFGAKRNSAPTRCALPCRRPTSGHSSWIWRPPPPRPESSNLRHDKVNRFRSGGHWMKAPR
jgi:LDH2 family malate/lactate/ureidoglycolate dehydrogenase